MSEFTNFDFKSFVSANSGKKVSRIDYLSAVCKATQMPSDFAIALSKLYSPDFKVVKGEVFISDLFDEVRYEEMTSEGYASESIQYWLNLLEITGLFESLSSEEAFLIACAIVRSWNAKLLEEYAGSSKLANAIFDQETGEVFVTLGALSK